MSDVTSGASGHRVFFSSGELKLEGVFEAPAGAGKHPAVVVCHPHPLYGGDMDNNVVTSIAEALVGRRIAALRFNFRGTGGSQGSFADGVGEQDDVRAAVDYLTTLESVDAGRIGLAGYSFGARVSLSYAPSDGRVRAIAAVSPQVSDGTAEKLKAYPVPKLFISGEDDQFMPAGQLKAKVKTFAEPVRVSIIKGSNHFWSGLDGEVGALVGSFFEEVLK